MRYVKLHKQEQGAALIVALIFLIVITLLGVSSMDDTVLETQLAKNTREVNYALQVAESGLMGSAPLLLDKTGNPEMQNVMNTLLATGEFRFSKDTTDSFNEVVIKRDDISNTTTPITATSENTEIYFKGFFSMPRSSGSEAYSSTHTRAAYFETLTEGQSALNQRQTKLRSGVRQAAPSPQ